MPHITPSPTLDASGVLASRLVDFLASKRPSAQEKLGDRRLDKARDLAQKNGDWISPSDLKIARDKVLQCVPSRKAYPSYVLSPISATEINAGLESKTGLSKLLQAREYRKSAKEAPFCQGHSCVSHCTGNNISHDVVNYRPFQTELEMRYSDGGHWA
ncbi:hypothetical protein BGY98DRAFT_54401 [Russula aff. rugulosa BPL654]|nr:hypothetical protein BGY98DRAFT_54401 [Russula aff. rugulosa BPL654]